MRILMLALLISGGVYLKIGQSEDEAQVVAVASMDENAAAITTKQGGLDHTNVWKPTEIVTEHIEAEAPSDLSESFQVLRPLSNLEIAELLPDDIEDTQTAWEVAVDEDSLRSVLDGKTNQLRLPTPEGWVGNVVKRVQRDRDTVSIMGGLEDAEGDDFLIVAHNGVVFGHVADYSEGVHYELRTAHTGDLLIRQLDQAARTAVCAVPDGLDLSEESSGGHETHAADGSCCDFEIPQADGLEIQADALHTIDVVVGYSAAARSADGGVAQIEARIISSVDRMNLAFDNSGIGPGTIELVLLATIEDPLYNDPGDQSGSMGEELSNLNRTTDGVLDAVSDLANHLGADLKAFVVRSAQGSAGIAYRPGSSSITARNYMSSDRITFVHELGHNIGLKHSWGDSDGDRSKTLYNYGWRMNGTDGKRYRTIMAYDWGWKRIPHFSNPAVNYQGVPTGAANGYDATGDTRTDSRYVSGGLVGDAGAGFDGSNSSLGARNAIYLEERAQFTADNGTRTAATPLILTQPNDLTLSVGQDTSMSVLAGGSGTLSYQWSRNGNPLSDGGSVSGATSDTLTLTSLTQADSGDYTVTVTNENGETLSSVATLNVVDPVPPSISAQPVSQDRNEGESVTFAISASGSPTPQYQWRKNGSNIDGATEASLTIASVIASDGAEYTCVVSNSAGSIVSDVAALTVNARPVVSVNSPVEGSAWIPEGVGLVLEATATDDGSPNPSTLSTNWSALSVPSGESVHFADSASTNTTATFSGPGAYVLRLTASDGAIADTEDIRVEVGGDSGLAPGTGVNLERFEGISGNSLSDLTSSVAFQNERPDYTEELTNLFEAGVNVANNYGQRIRGYFVAPQAGDYTFWLSSDDHSQLYLSTDNDPANKSVIASINGWTPSRNWTKYTSQMSAPITLAAGEAYYIEVLHKEGSGGDNAAVGVTFPDDTMERPLSAQHLALFEGAVFNQGASVETGGPYSANTDVPLNLNSTVIDDGALNPTVVWTQIDGPGSATFTDAAIEDATVTFNQPGSYRLRLTASDNAITTFAETVVTVSDQVVVNPSVPPYGQDWKDRAFGEGASGPNTELTADFNGDGRPNVLDYAFQIETMTAGDATGKLPQAHFHESGEETYFALQLRRIEGGTGTLHDGGYEIYGIRYHVECVADLAAENWESNAAVLEVVGEPISNGDGTETVTVRMKNGGGASAPTGQGFMRVRVDILP